MNILLSIDIIAKKFILSMGQVTLLTVKGLGGFFAPPFNLKLVSREVDNFGAGSLLLVDIIALFTGMVMAPQTIWIAYVRRRNVCWQRSFTIPCEGIGTCPDVYYGRRKGVGSGIAAEIGSHAGNRTD